MTTDELQQPINEKPLLTIAIPTYNRARCLRGNLEVLFDQLVGELRVELIISDNASTDETPTVVKAFIARGLQVRYLRNETNIGADANFMQCFEQAHGKHFLLLGDDDLIFPGGIGVILNIIRNDENLDMIFLTSCPYQTFLQSKNEAPRRAIRSRVVLDPIQFSRLVNIRGDFIFISSMIINKSRIEKCIPESWPHMFGSNIAHLALIFTALRKMERSLLVEDSILTGGIARVESWNEPTAATVFVRNYLKAMELWLGEGESKLQKVLIDDLMVFWFRHWIWMRRDSTKDSMREAHRLVSVLSGEKALSGRRVRYMIFVLPLVCLPFCMARVWNRLLRTVRRIIEITRYAIFTLRLPREKVS
jgi:glycosyltransferase involved in cell wall biosynthesis